MKVQRYPYYRETQEETRLCACGCGLSADYGSKFKRGHSVQKHKKKSKQMHHRRKSKS